MCVDAGQTPESSFADVFFGYFLYESRQYLSRFAHLYSSACRIYFDLSGSAASAGDCRGRAQSNVLSMCKRET